MKKYLGNSIMVLGSLVLVFGMFYVFSVRSLAGNSTNAGSTGSVTSIVVCEENDGEWSVDSAQVAINADGCKCEAQNPDWPLFGSAIDCDDDGGSDDHCGECLASLQRAGQTVVFGNGYFDTEDENETTSYLLTGNSGPFLSRLGGCPCL
jgi:hypothetical protein